MTSVPSLPLLTVDNAVATITLNRPAHRNRLEDADLQELLRHFERINHDTSIKVMVLQANTQGQNAPFFRRATTWAALTARRMTRLSSKKSPTPWRRFAPSRSAP